MGADSICAYLGVNINVIYVENNVIFDQENDAVCKYTKLKMTFPYLDEYEYQIYKLHLQYIV